MAWRPRDENEEADALTNQVYHAFAPYRRVQVVWDELEFYVLPHLTTMAEAYFEEVAARRRAARAQPRLAASGSGKRRKGGSRLWTLGEGGGAASFGVGWFSHAGQRKHGGLLRVPQKWKHHPSHFQVRTYASRLPGNLEPGQDVRHLEHLAQDSWPGPPLFVPPARPTCRYPASRVTDGLGVPDGFGVPGGGGGVHVAAVASRV